MQNIKINLNLPKIRLTFNDLGINNKNHFFRYSYQYQLLERI